MKQTDAKGLMEAYLKTKRKEVVAVVRCKDCKYRDSTFEWHDDYNCHKGHNPTSLNYYCADGDEKR